MKKKQQQGVVETWINYKFRAKMLKMRQEISNEIKLIVVFNFSLFLKT